VDVTLDPDTANPRLILSDDGKQVNHGDIWQYVPENPKRFDKSVCVLAKQGFSSGRFYYEVQVKGKTEWDLGVARESINRKKLITVDYEEGLVSFYDVESRSHLYSFTGQTFTDKLYPYFSPCPNGEDENSNPLIITPVR